MNIQIGQTERFVDGKMIRCMAAIVLLLIECISIGYTGSSVGDSELDGAGTKVLQVKHLTGATYLSGSLKGGEQHGRDRVHPSFDRWGERPMMILSVQHNVVPSRRSASFKECRVLVMLNRFRSLYPFHHFW